MISIFIFERRYPILPNTGDRLSFSLIGRQYEQALLKPEIRTVPGLVDPESHFNPKRE
jgi:hypothetical protein